MKPLPAFILAAALGCSALAEPTTLREAAQGLFHVGVAINAQQILGQSAQDTATIRAHFDSLTPENAMKWEVINPEYGRYDFSVADRYVALGEKNQAFIVGHTLLWHAQVPRWVFTGDDGKEISRDELAERLRMHIRTVMGRYKGRIHGWDVVNEAISDEGQLRTNHPWYRILGEDALRIAFQTARETDPNAELYYNDYSLWEPAKQKAVLALLVKLRAEGIKIDGVGLQEHYLFNSPSPEQVDQTFTAFTDAGFPIMVTEMDITTLPRPDNYGGAEVSRQLAGKAEYDPYRNGLPDSVQAELAKRYAAYFAVYKKHAPKLKRVTVWGLHDGQSWLNGWPIRGRVDHPLLFDRDGKPKPAVPAIIDVLKQR